MADCGVGHKYVEGQSEESFWQALDVAVACNVLKLLACCAHYNAADSSDRLWMPSLVQLEEQLPANGALRTAATLRWRSEYALELMCRSAGTFSRWPRAIHSALCLKTDCISIFQNSSRQYALAQPKHAIDISY